MRHYSAHARALRSPSPFRVSTSSAPSHGHDVQIYLRVCVARVMVLKKWNLFITLSSCFDIYLVLKLKAARLPDI
jgi:hypothetical protein